MLTAAWLMPPSPAVTSVSTLVCCSFDALALFELRLALLPPPLSVWVTVVSALGVATSSALATAWPRSHMPPAIPAMAIPFLTDRFIACPLRVCASSTG